MSESVSRTSEGLFKGSWLIWEKTLFALCSFFFPPAWNADGTTGVPAVILGHKDLENSQVSWRHRKPQYQTSYCLPCIWERNQFLSCFSHQYLGVFYCLQPNLILTNTACYRFHLGLYVRLGTKLSKLIACDSLVGWGRFSYLTRLWSIWPPVKEEINHFRPNYFPLNTCVYFLKEKRSPPNQQTKKAWE